MELVEYTFDVKDLKNKTLTIIPIGDCQYDGSEESTALGALKQTIKKGVEEGAFFIGMGDMTDFLSPSNRSALKGARLYDTAHDVIERAGNQLVDEIYEILKPTTGRFLGLLEGHHMQEFADGTTSDMCLAQRLRTRHLGSMAYIGINLAKGQSRVRVNIWASHGCGGGWGPGGPVVQPVHMNGLFWAGNLFLGHPPQLGPYPVHCA